MNIGTAFGFVMEDEDWVKKILVGGLIFLGFSLFGLSFIPFYGYMFQTARNVYRKSSRPLPDWNDLGGILMKGVFYFLISLAYSIPLIIIIFILTLVTTGIAGGVASMGDGGEAIGSIMMLCLFPVILIISIVTLAFTMVAFARYVQTDNFSSAFEFGKVISMLKANPGLWGMLIVVSILAGIVGVLGVIACGVGALFTMMYAGAVSGHALGQAAAGTDDFGESSDMPSAYGSPM